MELQFPNVSEIETQNKLILYTTVKMTKALFLNIDEEYM